MKPERIRLSAFANVIALVWISFLATTALPAAAAAAPPDTATLTVNVVGARNATGKIDFALYQDAKGFPDTPANAIRHELVAIDPKALTSQIVWRDLAPGVYAVSVLHDENVDGKMEKNFLGIPKEGHGASNNPAPARRPPTFDEGKFTLAAPAQTLEIKLRY